MIEDSALIFSIIRISVSLVSVPVALWLYRFFKGGIMGGAWSIFAAAAVLQIVAGLAEVLEALEIFHLASPSESLLHVVDRFAEAMSLLLFLLFAISIRKAWLRVAGLR